MLIIATRFKFEEVKKYVEDNSSYKLISNEYENTSWIIILNLYMLIPRGIASQFLVTHRG